MIVDKTLGITSEDILNATDKKQVREWQCALNEKMTSILAKNGAVAPAQIKKCKVRAAYFYTLALYKDAKRKYHELRELERKENGYKSERDKKREQSFYNIFYGVARKELPEETLLSLKQKAVKIHNELLKRKEK